MLGVYFSMATLLLVALLFGGMLIFSAGFAAFLFRYLPQHDARMLIRKAFPPFYLFDWLLRYLGDRILSVRH